MAQINAAPTIPKFPPTTAESAPQSLQPLKADPTAAVAAAMAVEHNGCDGAQGRLCSFVAWVRENLACLHTIHPLFLSLSLPVSV
jgi:hypothetical protein